MGAPLTEERRGLVRCAARLRSEGLMLREIAEALDVSVSYASLLVNDPDGSKERARKDRYRRPCPNCGRPMNGSGGHKRSPALCARCSREAQRYWTAERIVEAFREFRRVTGRTPAVNDPLIRSGGAPSVVARLSESRTSEPQAPLPHSDSVRAVFGSWDAAVRAAGLSRAPTGGAGHREDPLGSTQVAILDLPPAGRTARQIHARIGGDRAATNAALVALVRRGLLDRRGRGVRGDPYRYRLAP